MTGVGGTFRFLGLGRHQLPARVSMTEPPLELYRPDLQRLERRTHHSPACRKRDARFASGARPLTVVNRRFSASDVADYWQDELHDARVGARRRRGTAVPRRRRYTSSICAFS
jgi:hypothetical protein